MNYDVVVIGVGLAGLTAALRLAEQGQRVLVVAKGVGGTHLAPAAIDVLGYVDGPVESPAQALPRFAAAHPEHPYRRLSVELIRSSLGWLRDRLGELGYQGRLEENFLLPTAVGVAKPTVLVPETMAAGDLRAGGRFVFVGLRGFKDFYPAYLADNLVRAALPGGASVSARTVELAPPLGDEGDVSSVGFARRFEQPEFRDMVVRELEQRLVPGEIVGFPAVLGLRHAREVWQELETRLRHPVFEVPTLPPSVGGIRLFESMIAALTLSKVAPSPARTFAASESGTLSMPSSTCSSASGAPVAWSSAWASASLSLGAMPRQALRVCSSAPGPNVCSRRSRTASKSILDAEGAPAFENLHVAGATLAGAAPWREASGNGLSLATGYAAASAILERTS